MAYLSIKVTTNLFPVYALLSLSTISCRGIKTKTSRSLLPSSNDNFPLPVFLFADSLVIQLQLINHKQEKPDRNKIAKFLAFLSCMQCSFSYFLNQKFKKKKNIYIDKGKTNIIWMREKAEHVCSVPPCTT